MMTANALLPEWGTRSLNLVLPVANVRITGLSGVQADMIADQYHHFLGSKSHAADNTAQCTAFRLAHSPGLSQRALTENGQYAPRKVRRTDGIELTGINFSASIRFGTPEMASVGVRREQEFAYENVMENFLRVFTAYKALEQDGVVLHSAGLVFDDKAYIFAGRSNAGKTTLTRKAYEQGALVLSDDMNLVLPTPHGYQAHSVPFAGEFGRTLNQHFRRAYPLAGIVLLEQGGQLDVQTVRAPVAVAGLLSGCPFVNDDEHESAVLFDTLCHLVADVPVCRLISRRDDPVQTILTEVKNGLRNA